MSQANIAEPAGHPVMIALSAAVVTAAMGCAVLLGWLLDAPMLKSVLPGLPTMKANTALAFILAGTSLWLQLRASPANKFAHIAAAAVGLLAVATLCEHAFGWSLGIDQILFDERSSSVSAFPGGRMPVATAASFALIGGALLMLDVETPRGSRPAEWLCLIAALVSFLALVGYLYGVTSIPPGGPYASMALHTALTFLVLCLGILFARPARGWMEPLTNRSAGGMMARRLMPAAVLVPPLLGWLRTLGERAGWYDTQFGRALLICSVVVVFLILIWRSITLLNRMDTERQHAHLAAQQGQRLLQTIIDNSPAVIYAKDLNGRYLLVNQRFMELFQLGADSVQGKTDYDFFGKDAADAFRELDRRVADAGTALSEEEVAPHPDGPHTYISVKCPLHNENGEIYGVFGISTDITDRKQAETERAALLDRERVAREEAEALNAVARKVASELDLQQIVQAATDAATQLSGAKFGAFLYNVVNPQGEAYRLYVLSGAPREAFDKFGLPRITPLFEPTFRGTGPVLIDDVLRDARYGQSPPYHGMPPGHLPVRSYLAVPVVSRTNEVLGGLLFGHPEPAIFNERSQRIAMGIAAQAAIAIDNARLYQDSRSAATRLQSRLDRLRLLDEITRAIGQRQDLQSIFQVVLRSLEDRLPLDFTCVCRYDATERSLLVTQVGVKSPALAEEFAMPELARIDIDQNGLERCVHGQLIHDVDIGSATSAFARRLLSAGLHALVIAPLQVEGKVFGVLVAARCEARGFNGEDCEFLRQLSEHVALAAHQAQLYGSLQQAYEDLRRTQQAVLQQERLRALGQMASGIAHDINNAMSPAALYAQDLLEREPNLSERARRSLTTIQRAIEDVAHTVARMREFCRPREPQCSPMPVDINSIFQQVIELTRARWSDIPQERGVVVRLETDFGTDLPAIMGAESEIRDGLTNLIFNAIDAMPDGGMLTLRTRVIPPHEPDYEEAVRSVVVEVCDTGVGMDENARRRCLEPFFTTKGERGTGLGLAMVYGMVQRHGAELEIDTQLGKGTTVRLIFPAATVDTAATTCLASSLGPIPSLRILLVDDDPLLLKSLADVLRSDGHDVSAADGGQAGIDAVVKAQQRGERFGLVITDLGMPYVDGRKVAEFVRRIMPATPIVLLTGWGQRLLSEGDIPAHVDRVLSKPPKLRELRTVIRELVVEPAPRRREAL